MLPVALVKRRMATAQAGALAGMGVEAAAIDMFASLESSSLPRGSGGRTGWGPCSKCGWTSCCPGCGSLMLDPLSRWSTRVKREHISLRDLGRIWDEVCEQAGFDLFRVRADDA